MLTFQDGVFVRWVLNSVIYAVVSAVGAAFLATAAGYAFAKYQFPGGTALFAIILGAIMVPLAALTVPTYLLFARAQLTDTYWAVILPSLVSPFGVFLMRVYAADAVDDFADRGRPGRRGRRAPDLLHDRAPAAAARLGHRAAVHAGGDLEQLLPAADHAQHPGEVPAHGRPGPVGSRPRPAAPARRPCSPP